VNAGSTSNMSLSSAPFSVISKENGVFHLQWDNPSSTSVVLTVDANRGYHDIDRDSYRFSLQTTDPQWNPPPEAKAYWGVQQAFSSDLHVNLSYYRVMQVFDHSGQWLKSDTIRATPHKYTPDRSWGHILFTSFLTAGNRQLVSVKQNVLPPPRPTITVLRSQWVDGAFVVRFRVNSVIPTDRPQLDVRPSDSGLRSSRATPESPGAPGADVYTGRITRTVIDPTVNYTCVIRVSSAAGSATTELPIPSQN
jgi:hypothetical protein